QRGRDRRRRLRQRPDRAQGPDVLQAAPPRSHHRKTAARRQIPRIDRKGGHPADPRAMQRQQNPRRQDPRNFPLDPLRESEEVSTELMEAPFFSSNFRYLQTPFTF